MNPYQHHTDMELVQLLNQGKDAAFEIIYRRYVKELYAYVRRRIAAKEDCEEIIHNVFEYLWNRRRDLGHIASLKPYLFSSARFRAISYLRDEAVRKRHEEYFNLFELVYNSSNEEDQRDPEAIKSMIENSLKQLPDRCQEAIKMRMHENLSNDDIATRMNIKKTTVENYMVTALSHFREVYRKSLRTA
jgi:RNA polymerase sigma-70 factor (family 1)